MARKFWERVGANNIRFYDEPQQLNRDDADLRIAELQDIIALDPNIKALLVQSNPGVTTEEEFDAIFEDELEQLADQRDYWDYDQMVENITVVEAGWFSPSTAALGPGTILSASSEVQPAINAINGVNSDQWETDTLGGPHDIRFTWGYRKIISGIRFRVGPTVGNTEAWEGVSVWIASGVNGLEDDSNKMLDGVDVAVVGTLNDPWLELDFGAKKRGRHCRIEITGTGAGNNRALAREIELRAQVRTVDV